MSQHDDETHVLKIRTLNDEFRRTFEGGRILFTPGVMELPARLHKPLAGQIMTYAEFDESNDPYHEHDFGALTLNGHKLFWKIDYYDLECCNGSPDPSDPNMTTRVMTIMLASEY